MRLNVGLSHGSGEQGLKSTPEPFLLLGLMKKEFCYKLFENVLKIK